MCRNHESIFVHSIIICLNSDFHLRSPTFVFLLALFQTPPAAPISTLVPVDPGDGVLEEFPQSFLRAPKLKWNIRSFYWTEIRIETRRGSCASWSTSLGDPRRILLYPKYDASSYVPIRPEDTPSQETPGSEQSCPWVFHGLTPSKAI